MIVLDYSQVVISNLMSEIGTRRSEDIQLDVNLLRHIIINTIRSLKTKFEGEYGELVIACDSKKYWRKQYFPYYKANRKKAREESGLDWSLIFDTINLIKEELITFFPYKVIEVEGAEADDVIATLAKWTNDNDQVEGVLFAKANPFLVLSGDHDFIQLQKYSHVSQFSPVQKKFIKPTTTPEKYVIEHIIKGDKGDGIPNVLSSDDVFIIGERQKSVTSKKLEEWVNNIESLPKDTSFQRNFDRNKTLVDFTRIPKEIETAIINTFESTPSKDKSLLLNYFIQNRMKLMMEHIGEF